MAAVALLDAAARANAHWLRCKFPEFVKADALLLIVAGGAALWTRPSMLPRPVDPRLAAVCLASAVLASIKLLDLLLSYRRGLAGVVLVLAAANAAALSDLSALAVPPLDRACGAVGAFGGTAGPAAALLCPDAAWIPPAAAVLVAATTLVALARPLWRGLADVGFVGATFVGDRRRERGLVRPTRHTRA